MEGRKPQASEGSSEPENCSFFSPEDVMGKLAELAVEGCSLHTVLEWTKDLMKSLNSKLLAEDETRLENMMSSDGVLSTLEVRDLYLRRAPTDLVGMDLQQAAVDDAIAQHKGEHAIAKIWKLPLDILSSVLPGSPLLPLALDVWYNLRIAALVASLYGHDLTDEAVVGKMWTCLGGAGQGKGTKMIVKEIVKKMLKKMVGKSVPVIGPVFGKVWGLFNTNEKFTQRCCTTFKKDCKRVPECPSKRKITDLNIMSPSPIQCQIMLMEDLETKFRGVIALKKAGLYVIDCTEWQVEKGYNDFKELHESIKADMNGVPFPEKGWFNTGSHPKQKYILIAIAVQNPNSWGAS
jgi:hypothetical protein